MLAMPFVTVLDGSRLADKKLQAFNSLEPNPRCSLKDPIPQMIMTYNEYLHWYMLYQCFPVTKQVSVPVCT